MQSTVVGAHLRGRSYSATRASCPTVTGLNASFTSSSRIARHNPSPPTETHRGLGAKIVSKPATLSFLSLTVQRVNPCTRRSSPSNVQAVRISGANGRQYFTPSSRNGRNLLLEKSNFLEYIQYSLSMNSILYRAYSGPVHGTSDKLLVSLSTRL